MSVSVFFLIIRIRSGIGIEYFRFQFRHFFGISVCVRPYGGFDVTERVGEFAAFLFFGGRRGTHAYERVFFGGRRETLYLVTRVVILGYFRVNPAGIRNGRGFCGKIFCGSGGVLVVGGRKFFLLYRNVNVNVGVAFDEFNFRVNLRIIEFGGFVVSVVDDFFNVQSVREFSLRVLVRNRNSRDEISFRVVFGEFVVRLTLFSVSFFVLALSEIGFKLRIELIVYRFYRGITFRNRKHAFGYERFSVNGGVVLRTAVKRVVSSGGSRLGEKFSHSANRVVLLRFKRFHSGFEKGFDVVVVRHSVRRVKLRIIIDCIIDRGNQFSARYIHRNGIIPVVAEYLHSVAVFFHEVYGDRSHNAVGLSLFVDRHQRTRAESHAERKRHTYQQKQ